MDVTDYYSYDSVDEPTADFRTGFYSAMFDVESNPGWIKDIVTMCKANPSDAWAAGYLTAYNYMTWLD